MSAALVMAPAQIAVVFRRTPRPAGIVRLCLITLFVFGASAQYSAPTTTRGKIPLGLIGAIAIISGWVEPSPAATAILWIFWNWLENPLAGTIGDSSAIPGPTVLRPILNFRSGELRISPFPARSPSRSIRVGVLARRHHTPMLRQHLSNFAFPWHLRIACHELFQQAPRLPLQQPIPARLGLQSHGVDEDEASRLSTPLQHLRLAYLLILLGLEQIVSPLGWQYLLERSEPRAQLLIRPQVRHGDFR